MNKELKFESPSFTARIKGMLGVDFYRLFHAPLFYIFLIIFLYFTLLLSKCTECRTWIAKCSCSVYKCP